MSQLRELAKPFPSRMVKENPSGGGTYVSHHVYAQRLLMHLGGYSFERVEVIRGHVDAKPPNPNGSSKKAKEGSPALTDAIVGVICRLTVVVDGKTMVIEDVGDCESPHNWDTDGKRLKDAMSDALKRCCARIGLGTHLYAKTPDEYVLASVLRDREEIAAGPSGGGEPSGQTLVADNPVSESKDPTAPANLSPAPPEPSEFCDECKAGDCQHCDGREDFDACQCPHDEGRPM